MSYEVHLGKPFPLGAEWDGKGVNFAVFSENATAVWLCLFDEANDEKEKARIPFTERTDFIWHLYIPGLQPGQLYGLRVDGPFDPQNGHRFNKNKLLIDPNAKALSGEVKWNPAVFGYDMESPDKDISFNAADSAPFVPKAVVTDDSFDWEGDVRPRIPFFKSVIYEAHVKGLTHRCQDIPEEIRGTYLGIAHPVIIDHLKKLGITAIELMPVHAFTTDEFLEKKGLTNYWGYNTIGYFAPDTRYARTNEHGEALRDFKQMVKALHQAGIEVILDVVYNHTAEGNELGPTLSFKGIDNTSYYRLNQDDKRYYMDYTGTGNTLNATQPAVLRLIMDSLRYWVTEMHVDGFRFDLASALARGLHEVDRLSAFFDIIYQDPIISQVKLIAEPWDIGEGGYQVGKFPPGWAEWNGKYRDCMRDFWRGADSMLGEFAQRFTGSSDLYADDGRKPTASINFITAHDGFTLADLVSYNEKHNLANGEDNRDGESHNRSWNCGAEGPTDDKSILQLRQQQQRNFLTTLFLSQGVPMLVAGDEMGRSQQGNNNAYCQDNEISWLDWANADQDLLAFTQRLIKLRHDHPIFRRRRWFMGRPIHGAGVDDIAWLLPNGTEMTEEHWQHDFAKSLMIFLNGHGIPTPSFKGDKITDDNFLLLFNAHNGPVDFQIPDGKYGCNWKEIIHTASQETDGALWQPSQTKILNGYSIIVLQEYTGAQAD